MDKRHREVDQERLVFLAINEVQYKLAVIIRPKIICVAMDDFAITIDLRTVVATRLLTLVNPGPHAVFVETVFGWLIRTLVELAELPLSGDGGCVTGITKVVAERSDARGHTDTFALAD